MDTGLQIMRTLRLPVMLDVAIASSEESRNFALDKQGKFVLRVCT
jgi:hypothetical protein